MTSLVSEKIHQILQSFKIYTNFCTVDTLIFIDSKIKHGFCIIFTDAVNTTAGVFDVKLVRTGCLNLGISIGGDKLGDLWIADLKKGGVAHRTGSLQPGDALLAIDGHSLENSAPIDAANLLKNSGNIVTLAMRRDSLNSFSESFSVCSLYPVSHRGICL